MLPSLGSVTGTFTTETGTPVAGAEAELTLFQFQLRTFTTSTGQYTFFDVPVGTYTVSATHPPTSIRAFSPVTVVGDTTITRNTRRCPASGTVSGRVVYGNGLVASGVGVWLFGQGFPSLGFSTDPAGRFTFTNVPVGRPFTVEALHPSDSRRRRIGAGTADHPRGGAPARGRRAARCRVGARDVLRTPAGDVVPGAYVSIEQSGIRVVRHHEQRGRRHVRQCA